MHALQIMLSRRYEIFDVLSECGFLMMDDIVINTDNKNDIALLFPARKACAEIIM